MPYLLTATPNNPTNWVKMETDSMMSRNTEAKSGRRNLSDFINQANNRNTQNVYVANPNISKPNLSVNNFPTLPPLPSKMSNFSSISNYSLNRSIFSIDY